VACKEPIARGMKSLPDGFGSVLLHRADRLPVDLQLSDFRGGRIPIYRLGERLRPDAQRFFLGQVFGPLLLTIREVRMAARKKAVAGEAKPLPDSLLLPARDRPDGFPLGLQPLDFVGSLNPVLRFR